MKVCPNCGHLVEDGIPVCDRCGQQLAAPAAPVESQVNDAPQATGAYYTPPVQESSAAYQQPAPQAAPGTYYTPPVQESGAAYQQPAPQPQAAPGTYYTPQQAAGTNYAPQQQAYNPYGYQQNPAYVPTEQKASTGLAILSFFIPLAGIIIYFADKNTKPLTAKKSLKCALIGLAVGIVLSIITTIAVSMLGVRYAKKRTNEIEDFQQQFEQQLEEQFGESWSDFDSYFESQQD